MKQTVHARMLKLLSCVVMLCAILGTCMLASGSEKPAAVKQARESGTKAVFGQGWNLASFQSHIPTRQEIDAVCSDIPVYFLDDECHKAITNTLMLVHAGIIRKTARC